MPNPANDKSTHWTEAAEDRPSLELLNDFPAPDPGAWRALVEKDLAGAPFDKKLVWKTEDGIDVQPLYTSEDARGLAQMGELPGFAPFTRGNYPLSGVAPSWQVRQDCMLAAPEDVNASLRDALARGQTAIGIRLDNAARVGLDGDAPEARELSGRGGCTISSLNGMRIALADIDLTHYPVTFRTGTSALAIFSMLVALSDEREIDRGQLFGSVECDPLRTLAKSGRLRTSLDALFREMADIVKFCGQHMPGFRGVMVNSHAYHNGGASAAQELGCAMAAGVEYLRQLGKRGVGIDEAAKSIVFSMSVGASPFPEIAKLRAARRLWAKLVLLLGATDEHAPRMFLHVRTSTFTKTRHDVHSNLVRNAIEAFAGAVGGCDSMYIAPFDETVGRPEEFSMRLARNQHLLLKEEAQLGRVVDPAAGSHAIEKLTDDLARAAWLFLQQIEAEGGMAEALKTGWVQARIAETQRKREKAVTSRRNVIVGTSAYPDLEEKPLPRKHIPRDEFLAERRRRIARLKAVRDNAAVRDALTRVALFAVSGEGSLVEAAMDAAKAGATIGEIVASLNRAAAPPPAVDPVVAARASKPFERLRERAEAWRKMNGSHPPVMLATMGPLGMRRARADFCAGFFGAGGFSAVEPPAFSTPAEAAKAIIAHPATLVVLCSDDATYPVAAPEIVAAVKAASPAKLVWIAGYPADSVDMLREAGVDGFVHIKADAVETLTTLQDQLGIGA